MVSGIAARPVSLRNDGLWVRLMSELCDCSERHGGCEDCSRRPACVSDYDYVVDDLIQRREDAERFLEELKDA